MTIKTAPESLQDAKPPASGEAKPPRKRRSSPRFQGRREAAIAAARELFLSDGYEINMDEVASRAGLTKKTLYNHFGTKLGLLSAVLDRAADSFLSDAQPHEEGDLREVLTHYARLYEFHSLSAPGIAMFRLFVADVSKFPDIAHAFYDAGIDRPVGALTIRLQKAIDAGEIAPCDPRAMAERFIGALSGLVRHRAYAGLGIDTKDARRAYIADTVDFFLKGLQPD